MRSFLIGLAVIIALVVAGLLYLSAQMRKISISHFMGGIVETMENPEIRLCFDGRIPRTEKELYEAIYKVRKFPPDGPAKDLHEIIAEAPFVKLEWTPESDETVVIGHDGDFSFKVLLDDRLRKVYSKAELEDLIKKTHH